MIEAPASSSLALISSASAVATPSLTLAGAPSTRALASLRPRPVIQKQKPYLLECESPLP